jgi:hypothetical protein
VKSWKLKSHTGWCTTCSMTTHCLLVANTEARWRYTALVILAVDFAIHGSGSVDAAIVGEKSEQPSEAQGAKLHEPLYGELTSSLTVLNNAVITMQAQAMQS